MIADHLSRRICWSTLVLRAAAFVTALVTPLAALATWLLLTDPAVAADVAASGDFWPLVEAVVDAVSAVWKTSLELL